MFVYIHDCRYGMEKVYEEVTEVMRKVIPAGKGKNTNNLTFYIMTTCT